jgi:hypothetical protein
MTTRIEIQMREDFRPDGPWKAPWFWPVKTEEEARAYVAAANANHPGIWRVVRVVAETREVEVTRIEEQTVEISREVL